MMKSKYKIVYLDIDGTIRNDSCEISDRTKNVIKTLTDNGVLVVICSGRNRNYCMRISKECNASNYVVATNGSDVYDYNEDKVIFYNLINNKICEDIFNLSKMIDVKCYAFTNGNKVDNYHENICQCVINTPDIKKIRKIKEFISLNKDIKIVNQSKCLVDSKFEFYGYYFIDIGKYNTSKGYGIYQLNKYLNINKSKAVAIGDSFNDISMFDNVSLSIAMGNATTEVKNKASIITDSNNFDGVANSLIKIFDLKI